VETILLFILLGLGSGALIAGISLGVVATTFPLIAMRHGPDFASAR